MIESQRTGERVVSLVVQHEPEKKRERVGHRSGGKRCFKDISGVRGGTTLNKGRERILGGEKEGDTHWEGGNSARRASSKENLREGRLSKRGEKGGRKRERV